MAGKWRMSQNEAADLVRKTVNELGLGPKALEVLLQPPEIQKPNLRPPPSVPRYLFEWQEVKRDVRDGARYINGRISAEVNADRKKLESLSVYIWEEGDDQILVQ